MRVMHRNRHWVWGMAISCAGCGLVGYNFDGYRPQDESSGSGAASTGTGGSGSCTDGTQNNGETATDCGGPCPPCPCAAPFNARSDANVPGSSGIDIADMEGDGNLDILAVSHLLESVAVVYRDGTGTVTSVFTTQLPTGYGPQSVKAADFNADGALDIATTNFVNGSITILLNQGGTFGQQHVPIGGNPWGITTAEVNGDAVTDLVVTIETPSSVSLLVGAAGGSFMPTVVLNYPGATAPQGVAAGDLDGDGDTDLAVAYRDSALVAVFLHDPASMVPWPGQTVLTTPGPIQVALADFNGDGHLDIATTSSTSMLGTLLLGDGTGNFLPAMNLLPFGFETAGMAVADFNGDNHLDIAAAAASASPVGRLVVLLGDGKGAFQATAPVDNLKSSVSIAAADINHDDKVDLVAGSMEEAKVGIFLNTCP